MACFLSSQFVSCRCKKIEAGQHEPLPVEAIERDAMSTHVPAYDYPFVHQQVYACVMARARAATGNVISRTTGDFFSLCQDSCAVLCGELH